MDVIRPVRHYPRWDRPCQAPCQAPCDSAAPADFASGPLQTYFKFGLAGPVVQAHFHLVASLLLSREGDRNNLSVLRLQLKRSIPEDLLPGYGVLIMHALQVSLPLVTKENYVHSVVRVQMRPISSRKGRRRHRNQKASDVDYLRQSLHRPWYIFALTPS